MHYIAEDIPREINGKIWAALIAPRPIALISTQSVLGVPNIAPYNSFAGLATYPPMLGVSFSKRGDEDKHTLENIKATREFVINLVPRFLADVMNKSAEGTSVEDDFARLGLTAIRAGTVDCPRIGECPASIECRVTDIFALPAPAGASLSRLKSPASFCAMNLSPRAAASTRWRRICWQVSGRRSICR